jgi:predicted DNA-binding transcriptional regulator AlpA
MVEPASQSGNQNANPRSQSCGGGALFWRTALAKKIPRKIISRRVLLERVPLSYAKIWMLMRAGKFPRPLEIDRRSVWVESEVQDWIDELSDRRRLKGDA